MDSGSASRLPIQNDDGARIQDFYNIYEHGLGNLVEESFSFVECSPESSYVSPLAATSFRKRDGTESSCSNYLNSQPPWMTSYENTCYLSGSTMSIEPEFSDQFMLVNPLSGIP